MDVNMIYRRKKHLIVAQVIGFVFGVVFVISNGFATFCELISNVILGPILFAALFRFCVRAYQFAKVRFGAKVQDSGGEYIVIEKPGRGVLVAIAAPFMLIASVSLFFGNAPQWLRNGYIILLVLVGVFFCILDVRYMVKYKQAQKLL